MTVYGFHRQVVCYVTRTTEAGEELLVLDRSDGPGDPTALVRSAPSGVILPFEGIEEAAAREVREQTGLKGLTYVGQVGHHELGPEAEDGPRMVNYVHLQAPSDGERAWEYAEASSVTGQRDEEGRIATCRWEPLPLRFPLADGQAMFLDEILT
jgi:ADP-ribose pyrophosphatase YjhB (NUDIX family)